MADEVDRDDQTDLQQRVADRSVALQLMLIGFLEANLGADPPKMRRLIATCAVSEVLGRLLISDELMKPGASVPALQILDALRAAVTAAAVLPGEVRH